MISDVLFEAIEEIRRYQREFPESYDEIAMDIETVVAAMAALQRKLDHPCYIDWMQPTGPDCR